MEWRDEGFVLSARRHGERALVVELLTREHGRHAGLVRGGQSPRRRAVLQPGNGVATRLGMPVGSIGPTRARCLDKLRTAKTNQDFFGSMNQ